MSYKLNKAFKNKNKKQVNHYLMILMLLESGSRPSAVLGVKFCQISFDDLNFNLTASDTKTRSVSNDNNVSKLLRHF